MPPPSKAKHNSKRQMDKLSAGEKALIVPLKIAELQSQQPTSFLVGRTPVSIIKLSDDEDSLASKIHIGEKLRSQYGVFRFFQLFLSFVELGLIFALVAVDKEYRLYTIWLVQVPILCIITVLIQLFSPKCRVNNACLDMVQATLFFVQGVVLVVFYMFIWAVVYWSWRSDFFLPVSTAAAVFCFMLSLAFWVTGCSSACCRCLEHKHLTISIA